MRELRADLAIAGGGPSAIAAACAAAERGEQVLVIDRQPAPGGQIWRGQTNEWHERFRRCGAQWLGRAEIYDAAPGMTLMAQAPDGPAAIRAGRVLVATGARELFLPFPGWTLPGVYGAGGLQALVKSGLNVRGLRVVVAGSGPLLAAVAAQLIESGAHVLRVCEQAERTQMTPFFRYVAMHPEKWLQAAELGLLLAGRYQTGVWPVAARGAGKLEAVELSSGETIRAEALACGFGLVPNVELAQLLGCDLAGDGFVKVDEKQRTTAPGVFAAGEVCGIGGVEIAIGEGLIAGGASASLDRSFRGVLAAAFRLRGELRRLPQPSTYVCRCEDVTWSRIEPFDNWREAKLQTRCGMGSCQGRVCGASLGFLKGWPPPEPRSPLAPVPLESLASE
ncbi:MAG: FAD-dependent oxidoreductase [Bryobacteraceae bacterium]|nr:FAD-dependent oxidoreductase [Bryobacteraceae bacterium]